MWWVDLGGSPSPVEVAGNSRSCHVIDNARFAGIYRQWEIRRMTTLPVFRLGRSKFFSVRD